VKEIKDIRTIGFIGAGNLGRHAIEKLANEFTILVSDPSENQKIIDLGAIYTDLDERLRQSRFLAGENYTIADIATWPWIARHEWHDVGLLKHKNLSRWYLEISKRTAVERGYKFMDKSLEIPLP